MKRNLQMESCLAYLHSSSKADRGNSDKAHRGPVVTISRQCGARGTSVAKAVAALLADDRVLSRQRPWTVFDQNLLRHVIDEHGLPERTTEFFGEDQDARRIRTLIGEVLGLHRGVYNTHAKTAETIRHLAEAGNTVIVGRGANFITADIRWAIHVRLVGTEPVRIQHVARREGIDAVNATAMVRRIDRARNRYIRSVFRKEVEDPLHYDMVINSDHFPDKMVAELIVAALRGKIAAA